MREKYTCNLQQKSESLGTWRNESNRRKPDGRSEEVIAARTMIFPHILMRHRVAPRSLVIG
jgi:hypothetical protein